MRILAALAAALLALGGAPAAHDVPDDITVQAFLKPGADRVTWIEGTASDLGSDQFDMALMTSHVAQVFLEDVGWSDVLAHLRRALVPAGVLCFDTRDPRARAWEEWTSDRTRAPPSRWASASATVDLPEPDSPVITTSARAPGRRRRSANAT